MIDDQQVFVADGLSLSPGSILLGFVEFATARIFVESFFKIHLQLSVLSVFQSSIASLFERPCAVRRCTIRIRRIRLGVTDDEDDVFVIGCRMEFRSTIPLFIGSDDGA